MRPNVSRVRASVSRTYPRLDILPFNNLVVLVDKPNVVAPATDCPRPCLSLPTISGIMEALTEAPRTSSFVALAEHQSTTPASFHSGPPVLHYHSDKCKVLVLEEELQDAPVLQRLVSQTQSTATSQAGNDNEGQKIITDVNVWVTSEYALCSAHVCRQRLTRPQQTVIVFRFCFYRPLHSLPYHCSPCDPDSPNTDLY